MTWVKLDDAFGRNPKVGRVQPLARLLYVMGLCHCADQLTDGEIASTDLPLLYLQSGASAKHVEQLLDAALWVRHVDSYWVPDYLAYNPSREKVLAERENARKRKESQRDRQRDSRRDSQREFARSHTAPLPQPLSISSSDYENNAVQEPTILEMPSQASRWGELRQRHIGPQPLREAQ